MKESEERPVISDLQMKIKPERRAAKIANTKIAESTKILASTKIIATSAPPPPPKPRAKSKQSSKSAASLKTSSVAKSSASSSASLKALPASKTVSKQSKASNVVVHSAKTLLVTKKTSVATSILNPAARLVASSNTKTYTSGKIASAIQGKQVTLLTKPLLSGKSGVAGLGKVPLLVFSQNSGQVQSYIPLTTATLPPNTLISIAAPKRTSGTVAVSQPKLVTVTSKTVNKPSTSNPVQLPRVKKQDIGLIMECEDDELSAVQRIACKKAESDYVEMLRKLTKWKKEPEVEVITIGPDDPIPPVPVIPDVVEASKLPLPDGEDVTMPVEATLTTDVEMMEMTPKITEIQSGVSRVPLANNSGKDKGPISVKAASTQNDGEKSTSSISKDVPEEVVPKIKMISDIEKHPELILKLVPQKLLPHNYVTTKRKELDDTFKGLIASGPQVLEKWMLERGLFGTTRYCLFHSHIQMKLMYMSCLNDENNKSGYKWWCPSCAVMVNASQGSFFSRWKMGFDDILRVIYHWSCNTEVKKVAVEFENNVDFVCSVYRSLRSICNAQTNHWRIGGPNHSVELADMRVGNCKDAENVIIYCAYDRVNRLVVLGASRACNIRNSLASLFKTYVAKDTTIVGDRIIQPNIPPNFRLTFISSSPSSNAANLNAMAYLRDQVDQVLSKYYKELKLLTIQSILDELAWREKFAQNPRDAFSNIISHIKQAYVCSVVTTKGANSLPITMASGLKVVDTAKLQPDSETSSPAGATQSVTEEKLRVDGNTEEASAMETEDDDDYILPVTADCILEEMPDNEESIIIDTENDTIRTSVVSRRPAISSSSQKPADEVSSFNKSTKSSSTKPVIAEVKVTSPNPCDKAANTKTSLTVPLESYYYATMAGKAVKANAGNCKFKCPACKKLADDNVKMMRHIYTHIDNTKHRKPDLSDVSQCIICFKDFTSPYAMQTHVERVHAATSEYPVCQICYKDFPRATILQNHMTCNHKRFEMPYQCKFCQYRTSVYRDIIEHFQKAHSGTDKMQCRYCLQVFTIKTFRGKIDTSLHNFYRHVYKHQTKTFRRRCYLCCLMFLTPDELTKHKIADHISYKNRIGVIPHKVVGKSVNMMTIIKTPKEEKLFKKTSRMVRTLTSPIKHVEDPALFLCIECKTSLYRPNHFIQTMGCAMCKFVTSCSRAFADHAIKFHSVPPREKSKPFRSLNNNLNCACSYSTQFGDSMAWHIASRKCSYQWCYMETDEANMRDHGNKKQFEIIPTAVGPTALTAESEDRRKMLNTLGLMHVSASRKTGTNQEVSSSEVITETSSKKVEEIFPQKANKKSDRK